MMIYRIFVYFGSVFLVLVWFTLTMESEPTTTTSTSTTMNLETQLSTLSIGPGGTLTESLSLALATSASLSYLMEILKDSIPVDVKKLILTKLTVRKCCLLWKLIHEYGNENVSKTENIAS